MVMGWALGTGAAAVRLAGSHLPCCLPHNVAVIARIAAMCAGVAAGLWTGGNLVARLRARCAEQLHRAWTAFTAEEEEEEEDLMRGDSPSPRPQEDQVTVSAPLPGAAENVPSWQQQTCTPP